MIINIAGGTGQMGRTHKPIFEEAGHEVIISSRHTKLSLEEAAQNSDLTIVSIPIPYTEEMIQRLAPYCEAMMDFTSLKNFPINAMLKYSKPDCEIGGLHPLYGELSSIRGESVVYCPTNRSGSRCNQVIKSLMQAGAKIVIQTPEEHDKKEAYMQNARLKAIESYTLVIANSGMTIEEAYELAPPPTKQLLDLAARQFNSNNDDMYQAIALFNPLDKEIRNQLMYHLANLDSKTDPQTIRDFFSQELKPAQERARKSIENQKP